MLPLTIDPTLLALGDARALHAPEDAVRGVAAIMAKQLGLAVPPHVTLYPYAGRDAFEQGLIYDGRVTAPRR